MEYEVYHRMVESEVYHRMVESEKMKKNIISECIELLQRNSDALFKKCKDLKIDFQPHLYPDSEKWLGACMIVALYYGQIDLVTHLLQDFSFDINAVLFDYSTPLMYAFKFIGLNKQIKDIQVKTIQILDLLIENGANMNVIYKWESLLMHIISDPSRNCKQKIELLQLFLSHGVNFDAIDYEGTLLIYICRIPIYKFVDRFGYITDDKNKIVEYLIHTCKANPHLVDMHGRNALMYEIESYKYYSQRCHKPFEHRTTLIFEILIKSGVNVEHIDKYGNTALSLLYQSELVLPTELHLRLCTPFSINFVTMRFNQKTAMNAIQWLCLSINELPEFDTSHFYQYLIDLLSNLKHIDRLYDAIMIGGHLSAYESIKRIDHITLDDIETEYSDDLIFITHTKHIALLQELICKVKRKKLLTFLHAIRQKVHNKKRNLDLFVKISTTSRIDWSMHIASFLGWVV